MNESTNKMPFEPIAMPGLPDLPPMPPISEMPRPSFSRQSTPPVPLNPPPPRRSLPMDEEKPNPILLPLGISPEAPAPTPTPAPEPVPSGSWFRLSRGKGVVLAGLGSLAAGAFGLNILFPPPANEPTSQGQSMAEVGKAKPTTPTVAKIIEERPAEIAPPALLPNVVLEKNWNTENPVFNGASDLPKPVTITPVENQTPIPAPIPLKPLEGNKPAPLPQSEPMKSMLPPPALPGEEAFKPLAVPELQPTAPEIKFNEPAKLPVAPLVEKPKTELPPVSPLTELSGPMNPVEIKPSALPVANLAEPMKTVEIKPSPLPVTPLPEPLAPAPLPIPGGTRLEPMSSISPVAAKANTDYDVDIHKVRQGDTYQAISEKFYESKIYAAALRAYNDNADVGRTREIQVPPMHVIKKFSGPEPLNPRSGLSEPILPASDVEWGTPGTRKNQKPGDPTWR